MNHFEAQAGPIRYFSESQSFSKLQQIISTVILLILGYYVLSILDRWPSTTKRTIYDTTIWLIPSQFIYLLQHIMMHFGRLSEQDSTFHRENFGDFRAKEEALQRLFGNSPIPSVIQRARTLSGYDKLIPLAKELGPPGLGNWDNSCYQNSILQGLASLPAFQHYIHRSLLLCEKSRIPANTTNALATFIDQLSDSSCSKQTLWTPRVLKSMDSWQQQDAQEYFSRVMEAVEKEAVQYVKVVNKSTNLGLTCLRPEGTMSDSDKEKAVRKYLQTLIGNPMDGMLAQALTCQTCGFSEGVSLTQFNCLTVNLGLGGQRSIEQLLDEYTEPELIEGVECDNCTRLAQTRSSPSSVEEAGVDVAKDDSANAKNVKKELRVKAKQITFGRLPTDLIVHINRSIWDDYGNQVKNPSFVEFPTRLSFTKRWCAPLEADSDTTQAVYELKCIVTHSGRHDNGHYVAYGKRDKEWYCFNDELVTKLSEQQVLTRGNVFMLFYEAIDRTELLTNDEEETYCEAVAKDHTEIEDTKTSSPNSSVPSSGESDAYEEPLSSPLQTLIPVMRTAGSGIDPADSESPLGRVFVPAV